MGTHGTVSDAIPRLSLNVVKEYCKCPRRNGVHILYTYWHVSDAPKRPYP
jgi:predicted carbohydrate-binding protein with CBM5 and CBM33 domain